MSTTPRLHKATDRRYPPNGQHLTTQGYIREFFRLNTEKDRAPRAYQEQLHRRKVGFGPLAEVVQEGVDHAAFYTKPTT